MLLRWLEEDEPDIVCFQELKAPQEKFPKKALCDLGYDAIWYGQKSWNGVAMLSRVGEIHETRRGLPGDPEDGQSRYIEAAINAILIGGLYLPNGNPQPGQKFDYKLRWSDRLIDHAAELMPTDLDVYKPERWLGDALFAPGVRAAYFRLLGQGWTDALRTMHPGEVVYTSSITSETLTRATQACGSTISSSARNWPIGSSMRRSITMSAAGKRPAITRPFGSDWPANAAL